MLQLMTHSHEKKWGHTHTHTMQAYDKLVTLCNNYAETTFQLRSPKLTFTKPNQHFLLLLYVYDCLSACDYEFCGCGRFHQNIT